MASLSFTLGKLINIIFAVLIILITMLLVFTLWDALYGPDERVINQYRVMGDLMEGLVESGELGIENNRSMVFNFDVQKDTEAFQGTIFGISSDGQYSGILPPAIGNPVYKEEMNKALTLESLPRKEERTCTDKACLCLSNNRIAKTDDGYDWDELMRNVEGCRVIGKGKNVRIDFSTMQREVNSRNIWQDFWTALWDGKPRAFPVISLWLLKCEGYDYCVMGIMDPPNIS